MADYPKHPAAGSVTGQYFENDDGSYKVPAIILDPKYYPEIRGDLMSHEWHNDDFLLTTFPKNGTHFMWEVMMMLMRGSADYITDPKEVFMIDAFPLKESEKVVPSPRVLNTHYRTDVLPATFRKAKTVTVVRNPKDACVSYYYHEINMLPKLSPIFEPLSKMTFEQYINVFLYDHDRPYGSYFDYTEYMWKLRDDPNNLIIFFEDLKADPVGTIQKVNEFMGTDRSPEVVQKIADVTNFSKMKAAKNRAQSSEKLMELIKSRGENSGDAKGMLDATNKIMYRKGGVGDWKNHFTVAANEKFDEFLAKWEGGKDIPFKY